MANQQYPQLRVKEFEGAEVVAVRLSPGSAKSKMSVRGGKPRHMPETIQWEEAAVGVWVIVMSRGTEDPGNMWELERMVLHT